jgi:hypothetical protein
VTKVFSVKEMPPIVDARAEAMPGLRRNRRAGKAFFIFWAYAMAFGILGAVFRKREDDFAALFLLSLIGAAVAFACSASIRCPKCRRDLMHRIGSLCPECAGPVSRRFFWSRPICQKDQKALTRTRRRSNYTTRHCSHCRALVHDSGLEQTFGVFVKTE